MVIGGLIGAFGTEYFTPYLCFGIYSGVGPLIVIVSICMPSSIEGRTKKTSCWKEAG
jgi:hypothetical protein